MKFAYFYSGRSHQFEADPTVSDFALAYREAEKIRKADESLAAFLKLAQGKVTTYQKSLALTQAAEEACRMRDFAQAETIAASIPIDAVKKSARMQNLLSQSKAADLIQEFASENIAAWPFWKRGDGYLVRARAYAIAGRASEGEAELSNALKWITDPRARDAAQAAFSKSRPKK
jgi:hypothetical protein